MKNRLNLIKYTLTLVLLFTIFTSSVTTTQAMTTLSAGDIVVVGMSGDTSPSGGGTGKSFSFVPLVDLDAGTIINFTDSGWLGSSFRASEGGAIYTAPAGGTPAGTLISANGTSNATWAANGPEWTAPPAGVGNNGMNFSTSGDQVLVFIGAAATPTFLFALNGASTIFSLPANANDANRTALPTGLTQGTNAVAAGAGSGDETEFDNVYYTGITTGTRAELLAAVADATNWTGNNSNYSPPTANFIIETDTGELIINEIMYDPASSANNEWFEVKNISGRDIDINGCIIEDGNGGINHTITSPTTVANNAYFLFGGTSPITGVTVDYNYATANELDNSGDTIKITCNSNIVDSVAYEVGTSGWPNIIGDEQDNKLFASGLSIEFGTSGGTPELENDSGSNWGNTLGGPINGSDSGTPGAINSDATGPTAVTLQGHNIVKHSFFIYAVAAMFLLASISLWVVYRND